MAAGLFGRERQELERERGIHAEHLRGIVMPPQTGGKVKRSNGTVKASLLWRWTDGRPVFRDLDDVAQGYTEVEPHTSPDCDHAQTPAEPLGRQLRPKERRAFLRRRKDGQDGEGSLQKADFGTFHCLRRFPRFMKDGAVDCVDDWYG